MANIFFPEADYIELRYENGVSAIDQGDYVLKGNIVGFPMIDVAANELFTMIIRCSKVKAKKDEALSIDAGDAVYYNSSTDDVDKTNTGILVGYAIMDAATADEYCYIDFDGTAEFIAETSTASITALEVNETKTAVLAITADPSAGIAFTKAALGMSVGDKIIDMLITCTTSEANGTLKVGHVAGNDISDAGICAVAGDLARGLALDQAEVVLGAAELVVTGAGGTPANIRGIMYISYIPV